MLGVLTWRVVNFVDEQQVMACKTLAKMTFLAEHFSKELFHLFISLQVCQLDTEIGHSAVVVTEMFSES